MAGEQKNIDQVAKVIDDGVNTFLEGVEKSQSGIFNKTLSIVKELETDVNGNIKQTVKNLKLLTKVRKNIVDEVLTESYQKRVKTFTNEYPAIQSLNNGYFKGIEAAFDPNRELYNQIVQKSIQTTSASLLDSGIDQNVIEPIIRIVDDSVSTGATFTDMVDELRTVIKGDPERLGNLMRYSKQITQDALNQFNGIYNETIATDLDLEWYYYSGGKRRTSRPFCRKYAGKYFHKKEVEDFGKRKDLDGSNLCGGSSKTDLCQGRIPGTNSSSIFRYRAGYNCKHVYKPTTIAAVPKNVVDRNIKKGYYVPEGEEVITDQFVPAKTIKEAEDFAKNFTKNADYSLSTIDQANETNRVLSKIHVGKRLDKISYVKEFKDQDGKISYFTKGQYNRKTNEIQLRTDTDIKASRRALQRVDKNYYKRKLAESKRELIDDPDNDFLIGEVKRRQEELNGFVRQNVGTDTLSDLITHEYGHKIDAYNKFTTVSGDFATYASENKFTKSVFDANVPKGTNQVDYFRKLTSEYALTSTRELFAESYLAQQRGEKLPKWYNDLIIKITENAE